MVPLHYCIFQNCDNLNFPLYFTILKTVCKIAVLQLKPNLTQTDFAHFYEDRTNLKIFSKIKPPL